MTKTLRVRTKTGWITKPAADLPENRLVSEEVDDNFLAIEGALETHVGDSGIHVDSTVVRTTGNQTIGGVKTFSSTIAGSINGAAGSAATLTTARTINGTSFDGSGNITTANWGTNRTLTIGNTGKTVNGSGNVSWNINEVTNAGSPGDSYAAWGNGVQVGQVGYPATGTAIASFVANNNRGIQLATIAYDATDSLKFRRIHTGQTNGVGPWVDLVDTTINQTIGGTKTFSSAVVLSTAGTTTTQAVRADRTISTGTGCTGGGNLTANRTINVTYGTAAGTACQGNDTRLANNRQPIQNGIGGGTYDGTFGTTNDIARFFYHSTSGAPSDSPNNTQTAGIHIGTPWGRAQLAMPNNGGLFVRNGTATAWRTVLDSSNYNTYAISTAATQPNPVYIRNTAPTMYFRDIDGNSAMLHCNSNTFYILRGGNDSTSWSQVGGEWPLRINLTNNAATFGGLVTTATTSLAKGFKNTTISSANPSGGANGDVWFQF